MASAGSATSDKEDQVVAVLAARAPGPHFVEPERRLTFTRNNPMIPIGRASKVSSKGFVAAADNAWFDSPVMSRGHAELTVDFNTTPRAIYIKDIGSLHGTFHKHGEGSDGLGKENKLEPGRIVKLESGDTLRFGIDIYRSKETFPPCCVDFLVEETMNRINNFQQPSKTSMVSSRCFSVSVPEDDLDDEDLISDGDSIVEEETVPLPQQPPFPLSPSSTAAGKASTIDLTRDDAEPACTQGDSGMYQSSVTIRNAADSDLIDLTSEPEQESESEDDEPRTRRQSTPFPLVQQQSINVDTSVASSNVAWKPAGERFHSDPQDDLTSGPRMPRTTESYRSDAQLLEDCGSKVLEMARLVSDGLHFIGPGYETSSMSDSESPGLSTEEVDSNMTDEDEDEDEQSILSVESTDETTSQNSDAADQNSASSELGEENDVIDSMLEDFESGDEDEDLHYASSSSSSADEAVDDSVFVANSPFARHESPSMMSNPSSPTELEPGKTASKLLDETIEKFFEDPVSHTLISTAPLASVVTRQRLPSPSDAAMVKTLPFNTSCTTSTAQVLGEKTGKYEYFNARESNRATFMNLDRPKSPPPISAIRETLAGDNEASQPPSRHSPARNIFLLARKSVMFNKPGATNPSDSPPTGTAEPPKPAGSAAPSHEAKEPESKYTTTHHGSVWSASGDKFINSPASVKAIWSRTRLQSPEFDMTSAYTFQQSKLARESMADAFTVKRVQIQDLLAQEPKHTEPVEEKPVGQIIEPVTTEPQSTSSDTSKAQAGSKRTFNDAFEETDDVPGEADARSHGVALKVEPAGPAAQARHQQTIDPPESVPDSVHAAVAGSPAASIEPNTVRPAKRRRFAEVAACVALGGAGVLSALIMSAPTFT